MFFRRVRQLSRKLISGFFEVISEQQQINIFFNQVEWIFYHFKKVIFEISEENGNGNGGDKLVLSHNFSSLRSESL